MEILAVIPARYASTRFPGKPLASLAGRPMIQHVYERVKQAEGVTRAVVATDDERILAAVQSFGGDALLTRAEHRSGTDRVAEVAAQISADFYLNVQGDEPLIDPAAVTAVVAALREEESWPVATLAAIIRQPSEILDPNVVKVVVDFDGRALYFSRAPIPWVRDEKAAAEPVHRRHIGLYAFRPDALLEFPTLPPGPLERLEQLEQLRFLENGYAIGVADTEYAAIGVDTPEDVARVEQLLGTTDAESA